MKKLIIWTVLAIILMLGCPWLAVEFAGSAGMAVCFILFFAINPIFSVVCGVSAAQSFQVLEGHGYYYEYEDSPVIHKRILSIDEMTVRDIYELYHADIWNHLDKYIPSRLSFYCLRIER